MYSDAKYALSGITMSGRRKENVGNQPLTQNWGSFFQCWMNKWGFTFFFFTFFEGSHCHHSPLLQQRPLTILFPSSSYSTLQQEWFFKNTNLIVSYSLNSINKSIVLRITFTCGLQDLTIWTLFISSPSFLATYSFTFYTLAQKSQTDGSWIKFCLQCWLLLQLNCLTHFSVHKSYFWL